MFYMKKKKFETNGLIIVISPKGVDEGREGNKSSRAFEKLAKKISDAKKKR